MKLMTKTIRRKLPMLNANEGKAPEDIKVVVRYFSPFGRGDWYITEWDGEDIMFGLCCIDVPEFGYVSLKQLEATRLPLGLKIERSLYWEGTLADAMEMEGVKWGQKINCGGRRN